MVITINMKTQEYHKVYNSLKSQILEGCYAAGQKVPAERQLCQQYGVSRITARHALRLLEEDGLLERFQGRGTFIKAIKPAKLPITESGFAKSVKQYAPTLHRTLVKHGLVNPPAEITKLLHLDGNECFLAIRTDVMNKEVIAFDRAYICQDYSTTITSEQLKRVDFFEEWMESENLKILFYNETVEAIGADEEISSILEIKKGEPVLKSTEVYHDSKHRPVAVFESYYRGDCVKLTSTINYKGKGHVRVSDR